MVVSPDAAPVLVQSKCKPHAIVSYTAEGTDGENGMHDSLASTFYYDAFGFQDLL